jgi:hypothetical protein
MNNLSGSQLNHIRGDNLSRLITIEYSDGTPFNLTGYTAFFTIKNLDDESLDDSSAIFAKSWTSHSDAVNGETLLTATASEMAIEPNIYKYDIQIKSPAGAITTVIIGQFEIIDDTTKRIV